MNQAKRELCREMSWENPMKKLCTYTMKTSLEDLSNELLYEIFDYLDLCEIYLAFRNLNQRLENLIFYSDLPLKCTNIHRYKQSIENLYLQMIIPNQNRILSLNLSNHFDSMKFIPLSSFHRLQSLNLHQIKAEDLLLLIPILIPLSQLFSLTISLPFIPNDPNEIYRLIFQLPTLKYHKLSTNKFIIQNPTNYSIEKCQSSIEYLIIDHPCTRHGLYDILSSTPKLRHLTCVDLIQIPVNPSVKLIHLKSLTIHFCYLKFDQFEIFIRNFATHLQCLDFQPISDTNYLDANHWENLIIQHMPRLRRFQFKYFDAIFDQFQYQIYHSELHRFSSPFWIEKGWRFHIEIDLKHWQPTEIIYSIESPKSNEIFKSLCQLTIRNCHFQNSNHYSLDFLRYLSSLTKITQLHIEFQYFSLEIFLDILHLFSQLDFLTIQFTILNPIHSLTNKQIQTIYSLAQINQIKHIHICQLCDYHRLEILLHLCLQMQSLQIKCQNEIELQTYLRLILTNKSSSLTYLSFYLSRADDFLVKTLQTWICREKLLVNYTIKRIQEDISIEWQRH